MLLIVDQLLQSRLHRRQITEGKETLRALSQLASRLLTPKEQHAKQGQRRLLQTRELAGGVVLEFLHPRTGNGDLESKLPGLQALQRLMHRRIIKADHRIAIRALIACRDDLVQRHRVILRRRALLLDQATQDAGFFESDGRKLRVCWRFFGVHGVAPV